MFLLIKSCDKYHERRVKEIIVIWGKKGHNLCVVIGFKRTTTDVNVFMEPNMLGQNGSQRPSLLPPQL